MQILSQEHSIRQDNNKQWSSRRRNRCGVLVGRTGVEFSLAEQVWSIQVHAVVLHFSTYHTHIVKGIPHLSAYSH